MSQQPLLFDIPASKEKLDRLFIGLFLEGATAQVDQLAPALCSKHDLRGKLRPINIRHLTLCHIDDYDGIPATVVDAVSRACAEAASKVDPLDIQLDHAMSFPSSQAFVLCDNDGNAELRSFQRLLFQTLIKHGVRPRDRQPPRPHVTLTYDDKIVAIEPIEPVCWTAHEIVLVHSFIGQTKYERLGQWQLGSIG